MSLSSILSTNGYDLFCSSLTASGQITQEGDVPKTLITNLSLYTGATPASGANLFVAGITLEYQVVDHVCYFSMRSSSGGFGNGKTAGQSSLKVGDNTDTNGYFTFPRADSDDEVLFFPITLQVNGASVIANLLLQTGLGVDEDKGLITLQLLGGATFNVASSNNNLYNFALQYRIAQS